MTDNNKPTPQADDKTDSSTHSDTENHQTHTVERHILPGVAVGLSVIALAASGWLYIQSSQNTLGQDIALLSTQQATLSSQLEANRFDRAQLDQLLTQTRLTEETLKQQQDRLVSQQAQQADTLLSLDSKVNRLNTTTKEDWKLAEAAYLIRLANQRLLLESDSSGAVSLLNNADDILKELEDPIVFATRKALAKDIQALKSVNPFDLEGTYLKLNALYDSAPTLPQREPSKEWQAITTASTENIDTSGKVTSVLNSFWESIRSLIVINYNQQPIEALLPPAQYQQLVVGLQLQLEIAQVALIKGESVIYQQALERVANATTSHFDTQSKAVISFLSSLTMLQQLNPAPDLPQPRDSLIAIKALMSEWNGDNVTDVSTEESAIQQTDAEETTETTGATKHDEGTENPSVAPTSNTKTPADATPIYLGGDA